jgi:hypothetical protein
VQFDSLSFLVLNFEDVLLVVFATCSSHEDLVLGGIRLAFANFGKDKRFFMFLLRVVD